MNKFYEIIDKIGKHNFVLIVFIIIALITTSLYQTFSLYTESDGVSIIDGIKTYSFILDTNNTTNSVTIAAGNSKNIDITVSNESEAKLLYGLYYSSNDNIEYVNIGYLSRSAALSNGIIKANSSYIVTIKIDNFADEDVTISLGLKYGFEKGGELVLNDNQKWIGRYYDIKDTFSENIRVTGLNVDATSSNGISNFEDYGINSIYGEINLPNNDSSVTYKVSITNFESPEMGIFDITGLSDNLEYFISEYSLKDKICNDDNKCNLGITKDIYITIKYKNGNYNSNNTLYSFNLLFDFRAFHTVNYENIYGVNYPIEIIDGESLILDLGYDDVNLAITSDSGYKYILDTDYEYENGWLTIPLVNEDLYIDVNGNIIITNVTSSDENGEIIKYFDNKFNSSVVLSNISSSQLKFNITVYNTTDDNYVFTGTTADEYDNNNIIYTLSGLSEGDMITSGESKQFSLVFKYKSGINFNDVNFSNILNSFLKFNFSEAYYVTYENFSSTSGYPSYVKAGTTLRVSFGTLDAPIEVKKSGSMLSSSDYSYSNYVLTINGVDGDIHIRKLTKYTMVNMVTNGSFEDGLNGWTISGDSNSWGIASIPAYGSRSAYRVASSASSNFLMQNISGWISGHKYYYFGYASSVTPQSFVCNITNRGGKFTQETGPDSYLKGRVIYTADFTGSNNISINYAASSDNINVDGIGLVDLTATFGAGNEPTLQWCNANINYFDGSHTFYK